MLIVLLIFIAFVFLLLLSWILLIRDRRYYNIPGPSPLPLLGNGLLFLVKRTEFIPLIGGFQKKYGNAVQVHLFHDPYVFIYHPKYIEPLISHTELITKGKSYTFLHDWLGYGLLTSTGEKWRTHRKFLTPAFHFNILQNFLPIFLKNEKILIKKLKSTYCDTEFDLFPVIALTALDNITESIMGVSFHTQESSDSKYVKCIDDASQVISLRMRNAFLAEEPIFKLSSHKKIQDKALEVLHGHTKKVIEIRKQELKKSKIETLDQSSELGIKNKHAFLDLLLLAEVDGKKLDEESIREEVDTFMFEGHDTTTSGITYTLFCISKHKDVQQKIYDEQKQILGDDLARDPSYSELKEMKYLEQVIKESLRLYPSVPMIERLITKDSVLGGLRIKKNTSVIMDIFHMQRNPEVYEDPMEFRPERFANGENLTNPFAWLAFSAGPRNCIGQKFAMMEMKVIISSVVKNFRIFPGSTEPALCSDLILRSENGVKVKLVPRNHF